MAWHYLENLCESLPSLPVQAGDCSALSSAAGELSAPLKSTTTADVCSCNGSAMECSNGSLSGMTCGRSTGDRGVDAWISSLGGSPARTSAPQEEARESTVNAVACGLKWQESLVKYDRVSCSWKTRQHSLFGGLEEFSETWPEWGSMHGGECWAVQTPAGLTTENEFGYWPTLKCIDSSMGAVASRVSLLNQGKWSHDGGGISRLTDYLAAFFDLPPRATLNPDLTDWWMGWPVGWTEENALATDKFQQWLEQHGICSASEE